MPSSACKKKHRATTAGRRRLVELPRRPGRHQRVGEGVLCAEDRGPRHFFFNDTATTEIYTLSLHDALPIPGVTALPRRRRGWRARSRSSLPATRRTPPRSEEHTSELQSRPHLVCRLLLEKKKPERTSFQLQDKKPYSYG